MLTPLASRVRLRGLRPMLLASTLSCCVGSPVLAQVVSNNTSGYGAPSATGTDSTAVAPGATATGTSSLAVGNGATATGVFSTAVGVGSVSTGAYSTSYGWSASATGAESTALGQNTQAYGNFSTAVGNSSATGDNTVSLGNDAAASASGASALGRGTTASGTSSTAVGYGATASGVNAIAIGAGTGTGQVPDATTPAAKATATNGIAIGAQSSVTGVGSIAIGTGACASGTNSVAIGTGSCDGGVSNTVSVGSIGATRSITNVTAGSVNATSTDAVTGSQLYTTNQALAAAAATANNSVQYSTNATTGLQQISLRGTLGAPVVMSNVGAGAVNATSTDAVTGAQLYQTQQGLATLQAQAVVYDQSGGTNANSITLRGGNAAQPVAMHNVAAGTQATDAVNFGQLQSVTASSTSYTNTQVAGLKSYTDQRFAALGQQTAAAARDAHTAGAMALALSGMHFANEPGRVSAGFGAGHWKGETAFAAGLGYSPARGMNVSLSGTATQNGEIGVSAGATFVLN